MLSLSKPREKFHGDPASSRPGADDTCDAVVDDIKKLIEKFQLPGVDIAALVDWQRKDMETLVEANRQAYEGVQGLSSGATRILQETLAQFQAAVKDATSSEAMRNRRKPASRAYNR